MITQERNKAGFRRAYEEGLNGGNLAVADELIDPEFLDREAQPGRNRGPESFRQLITMLRTAFPDLHFVCFRDGKAIEHWGLRDDVGMMRQMGLMPEPRRSKEASPT